MTTEPCLLCDPAAAEDTLQRTVVWEDDLWRATVTRIGPVAGFTILEPKRHIADITELDGPEAETCGPVLAKVSRALKETAGSNLVFVYLFGQQVSHLHFGLTPHHPGDGQRGSAGIVAEGTPPPDPDVVATITSGLREALRAT